MKNIFFLLSLFSIHLFSSCFVEDIYYYDDYYDSYDYPYIDCNSNNDIIVHHHYDDEYNTYPDYPAPDVIINHYSEPPITYENNTPAYLLTFDSHLLVAAAYNGEWIQLENGSVWSVTNYYDKKEVLDWKTTDPLYIYPNKSIFSAHKYKIVNDKWGTKAEITLIKGADLNYSENINLITFINYKNNAIYLNDNTIWYVASDDSSIIKNWEIDDPIMIGSYKSFFSSYKNILINLYETKSNNSHVKVKL